MGRMAPSSAMVPAGFDRRAAPSARGSPLSSSVPPASRQAVIASLVPRSLGIEPTTLASMSRKSRVSPSPSARSLGSTASRTAMDVFSTSSPVPSSSRATPFACRLPIWARPLRPHARDLKPLKIERDLPEAPVVVQPHDELAAANCRIDVAPLAAFDKNLNRIAAVGEDGDLAEVPGGGLGPQRIGSPAPAVPRVVDARARAA